MIVPQMYDQHYFARRVQELGIGSAHAPGAPTTESLTDALRPALRDETAERAHDLAATMTLNGAALAAQRLISTDLRTLAV